MQSQRLSGMSIPEEQIRYQKITEFLKSPLLFEVLDEAFKRKYADVRICVREGRVVQIYLEKFYKVDTPDKIE